MINDNNIKGYYQLFFKDKPYGKKYPTKTQAIIEAFEKGLVSMAHADFIGDTAQHFLHGCFSIKFVEDNNYND